MLLKEQHLAYTVQRRSKSFQLESYDKEDIFSSTEHNIETGIKLECKTL
jgi:hypothetical protein